MAILEATEVLLQAEINGAIGDLVAAIRPKADRVQICVSGNLSPKTVIGAASQREPMRSSPLRPNTRADIEQTTDLLNNPRHLIDPVENAQHIGQTRE